MEQINNQIQRIKEQALSKSQQSQTEYLETCQTGKSEISIYSGELTKECVAFNLQKVKNAFPALSPDFYTVFMDRVKDNGFSNNRLTDAVQYVIDNCVYPQPTIAQFISFDKKIKLYTYEQAFDNPGLVPVKLENRKSIVWISKIDAEIFGIEIYNAKETDLNEVNAKLWNNRNK